MAHYVYILASRPGGALYVGRTGDLRVQIARHRAGLCRHTARYNIRQLVWFECHDSVDAVETSLRRARSIKRWRRNWKGALISQANPDWQDLTHEIPGPLARAGAPVSGRVT